MTVTHLHQADAMWVAAAALLEGAEAVFVANGLDLPPYRYVSVKGPLLDASDAACGDLVVTPAVEVDTEDLTGDFRDPHASSPGRLRVRYLVEQVWCVNEDIERGNVRIGDPHSSPAAQPGTETWEAWRITVARVALCRQLARAWRDALCHAGHDEIATRFIFAEAIVTGGLAGTRLTMEAVL